MSTNKCTWTRHLQSIKTTFDVLEHIVAEMLFACIQSMKQPQQLVSLSLIGLSEFSAIHYYLGSMKKTQTITNMFESEYSLQRSHLHWHTNRTTGFFHKPDWRSKSLQFYHSQPSVIGSLKYVYVNVSVFVLVHGIYLHIHTHVGACPSTKVKLFHVIKITLRHCAWIGIGCGNYCFVVIIALTVDLILNNIILE